MSKEILTVHQCFEVAHKQPTPTKIGAKYKELLVANGHIITKEGAAKQRDQFEKEKAARKKENEKQNKEDKKHAKANEK